MEIWRPDRPSRYRRGYVLGPQRPQTGLGRRRGPFVFNPLNLPSIDLYASAEGAGSGGVLEALDTNPAALAGSPAPSWVLQDGFRALRFNNPGTAGSYLDLPNYTAVVGTTGSGTVGTGGAAVSCYLWLPTAAALATTYDWIIFGKDDSNIDVYMELHSAAEKYNIYATAASPAGDHRGSVAPLRDQWFFLLLNLHGNQRVELWQNNTLAVPVFNWTANWSIESAGGIPGVSTYNPADLYMRQLEIWPRALSPSERQAKVLGNEIPLRSIRRWMLDETSGTTAHDGALTVAAGGAIASLTNQADGARPLAQPTAGDRPIFAVRGLPAIPVAGADAPPLDNNPPPVDDVIRFDTDADQLFDTGMFTAHSPMTAFSLFALVRCHDFYRGNVQGTRRNWLGVTNTDPPDLTNGSGTECVIIRSQLGSSPVVGGSYVEPALELVVKKAGGNAIILRGDPVDAFLMDVGVVFSGGNRIGLWQRGAEVAFTTTSIPADLSFDDKIAVPIGADQDGLELIRIAAGHAAWSSGQVSRLLSNWRVQVGYVPTYHELLKGSVGGWTGSDRHAYHIGCIIKVLASGKVWAFIVAGPSDPGVMDILHLSSTDRRTWTDHGVFKQDLTDTLAWTAFGGSAVELALGSNPGRFMIFGGSNPATPPYTPWYVKRWRTDNPNAGSPTWTEEFVNTDGTLAGYDYWFVHGRIYEVGADHLRGTGYGLRTGDTNLGTFIWDSVDGGLTLTVHRHLPSAAGATDIYSVEPAHYRDPDDPNRQWCHCRNAATGIVFETEDDWATVKYPVHHGDNATMPTHIEMTISQCHDEAGNPINEFLLGEGIRDVVNPNYDAVERFGYVVGRIKDGVLGRRLLAVPMVHGQSAYSSLDYVGLVNGKPTQIGLFQGDTVHTYVWEFPEEAIPWIPN